MRRKIFNDLLCFLNPGASFTKLRLVNAAANDRLATVAVIAATNQAFCQHHRFAPANVTDCNFFGGYRGFHLCCGLMNFAERPYGFPVTVHHAAKHIRIEPSLFREVRQPIYRFVLTAKEA